MAARVGVSRMRRVQQWLQFSRQWHMIDAKHQDATLLGEKVAAHLAGKHKPIWHPETDCGDHVVVVNCGDVSMHAFDWKHKVYHFDKGYPRARADLPAWQLHEYDPCRIVFLETYKALGNNLLRRRHVQRLHLASDEDIPAFLRQNVGNQLEQVQSIARRSDEYSAEERAAMPRLVKYAKEHVVDWETAIDNPGRHVKSGPGKNKEK